MKTQLSEGMREGDLVDLVLPLISVDEYASKVDASEAIVIGFYVHDEAAAKDLNRFLQKSAVPLLGTEVSPAPDQHGYFMVFVEMMDNDRLATNLVAIIQEIDSLVDVEEWHIRVRAAKGLVPFTAENLEHGLVVAKKASKRSEVVEYLQYSALHNAEFIDGLLILEGAGERYCFEFIGFDRISTLLSDYHLTETAVRYDIRSIARGNKITRMLGENWEASRLDRYLLLHLETDRRGLLLK